MNQVKERVGATRSVFDLEQGFSGSSPYSA